MARGRFLQALLAAVMAAFFMATVPAAAEPGCAPAELMAQKVAQLTPNTDVAARLEGDQAQEFLAALSEAHGANYIADGVIVLRREDAATDYVILASEGCVVKAGELPRNFVERVLRAVRGQGA